jgi:hypothetical protein
LHCLLVVLCLMFIDAPLLCSHGACHHTLAIGAF